MIARLLIFLALLTVGVSGVLYLFTRDKRYIKFAWLFLRFTLVFLAAFGALYVLERLVLI